MPTYNHAFEIAFTVAGSTTPDGAELTPNDIRIAILTRLASVDDSELMESVGTPFNPYEEQGDA